MNMTRTLLLDPNDWDLHVNEFGELDVIEGAYAIAQNVANATRLFTNDAYFKFDEGIPHMDVELGVQPIESVVKSRYREAALKVAGVADAVVDLFNIEDRVLSGRILLTLDSGEMATVEI